MGVPLDGLAEQQASCPESLPGDLKDRCGLIWASLGWAFPEGKGHVQPACVCAALGSGGFRTVLSGFGDRWRNTGRRVASLLFWALAQNPFPL